MGEEERKGGATRGSRGLEELKVDFSGYFYSSDNPITKAVKELDTDTKRSPLFQPDLKVALTQGDDPSVVRITLYQQRDKIYNAQGTEGKECRVLDSVDYRISGKGKDMRVSLNKRPKEERMLTLSAAAPGPVSRVYEGDVLKVLRSRETLPTWTHFKPLGSSVWEEPLET